MLIRRGIPPEWLIKRANGHGFELWVAGPADLVEPMDAHNCPLPGCSEAQMIGGDDALAQLLQVRAGDDLAETAVGRPGSSERGLHSRPGSLTASCSSSSARLGQILGLVHDQQGAAPLPGACASKKFLQAQQQPALVLGQVSKPNAAATIRSRSWPESMVVTTWAATILLGSMVAIRRLTRVVLPAPTSPVMTIKPSPRVKPVGEMRHRLGMNAALKIKPLVRRQEEWLGAQIVKARVHRRRA